MALIYFVEDDQSISYIIQKTLDHAELMGLGFSNAEDFFKAFRERRPDMILLDVMLPQVSGIDILKTIRKIDNDVPIMMISALQSEMDKVIALDYGADDYMTKPFGVFELTSRIQSKLRKRQSMESYFYQDLIIDDKKHQLTIHEHEVYLTQKEYDILKLLIKENGKVVSKETIFKLVWDTDFIGESRTLDMHIKSLREKLKNNDSNVSIKTIRSIGYQVE
ncbi:MAG: response regulator transcription factor [Acholeplasmataceae bacterium]|nr:response regulator transcription factor [Acholeplasmataceae bacterium]